MIKKIKSGSISRRLSIYIVSLVAILFLVSFGIFFSFSQKTITQDAFDKSTLELTYVTENIDGKLIRIEQSINDAVPIIKNNIDSKESLVEILEHIVSENSTIDAASIAFRPGYFEEDEDYFMPYVSLENQEPTCRYFGGINYDYHVMAWYLVPKLLKKPYWAEPYYDEGGANMIMTTFSHPIYDEKGEFVAILSADIAISWLTDLVVNMKPYENSYAVLISRNGYYLAHNDESLVLNDTYFTHTSQLDSEKSSSEKIKQLGLDMIAQKSGQTDIKINGEKYYAFYAPIKRAGWSITMASPRGKVLSGLRIISILVWIILFISLGAIFMVVFLVVKRVTDPLKEFTEVAAIISQGNFDVPLPQVENKDEVYELREAFANMQKSLSEYIEELKSSTATKQRIESELAIAQQIQMGMVPKIFPPYPESRDLDIYATITPAKEVGGDLYDFFVRDEKLFFTIGDVSGKGIPASLLMAVSCSLFRSIAAREDDPTVIVSRINESICANNDANMFVTMFVAVLDIATGEMNYCNAGHNPPLILSKGSKAEFLQMMPNIAVGVFDEMEFVGEKCTLKRGETIFMYTDGLTEAENFEKELYGEDRLCSYLHQENRSDDIVAVCNGVNESLANFTSGNEQSDDITMLYVQYKEL